MAHQFDAILDSEIEVGKPLKKSLFTKIQHNLDLHEQRIGDNAAGVAGTLPLILRVNGDYALLTPTQKANVLKTTFGADIIITNIFLYIDEAGTSGTTEIDILTNTTAGPSYTTVFSTKASADFGDGDDFVSTDGVLDSGNVAIDAGDILKLAITDSQVGANGFMVRIDYTFS